MSRPLREGLEYFPLDCKNREELELVEAECGGTGFAIAVKLFQSIYGNHGYYLEWAGNGRLLFIRYCGYKSEEVEAVVECGLRYGVFDEGMYRRFGILTSRQIQLTYFLAAAKRARLPLKREWLLMPPPKNAVFEGESVESASETPVSAPGGVESGSETTQSRAEESREEERRAEQPYPALPGGQGEEETGGGGAERGEADTGGDAWYTQSGAVACGGSHTRGTQGGFGVSAGKKESPSDALPEGFDEFWSEYPKHAGRLETLEAWKQLQPDAKLRAEILSAVQSAKRSQQWKKESGRFIPRPANFLLRRIWEEDFGDIHLGGSYTSADYAMMEALMYREGKVE